MRVVTILVALVFSLSANAEITKESLSKLGEIRSFWVEKGYSSAKIYSEDDFNKKASKVLTGDRLSLISMAIYSQSLQHFNNAPLTIEEKELLTFELYKGAAIQKEPAAQKRMSVYYETGYLGLVEVDQDISDMWLILSAENGAVFFDETRIDKALENDIAVAMAKRCRNSKYKKCE